MNKPEIITEWFDAGFPDEGKIVLCPYCKRPYDGQVRTHIALTKDLYAHAECIAKDNED